MQPSTSSLLRALVALLAAQVAAAPIPGRTAAEEGTVRCMAMGPTCEGTESPSNSTIAGASNTTSTSDAETPPLRSEPRPALTAFHELPADRRPKIRTRSPQEVRCMALGPLCEGTDASKQEAATPAGPEPEMRCMAVGPLCEGGAAKNGTVAAAAARKGPVTPNPSAASLPVAARDVEAKEVE